MNVLINSYSNYYIMKNEIFTGWISNLKNYNYTLPVPHIKILKEL